MSYNKIIGIVGSSKAVEIEHFRFVDSLIQKIPYNTIIVTGDAFGIDFAVRRSCLLHKRLHSVIYSKSKKWSSYKKRNKIIAEYCDEIISIALPKTKTGCYHCNRDDHERTGGCYTGKINGNYTVKIIPEILKQCTTNQVYHDGDGK